MAMKVMSIQASGQFGSSRLALLADSPWTDRAIVAPLRVNSLHDRRLCADNRGVTRRAPVVLSREL
jgi:hypothetical protein